MSRTVSNYKKILRLLDELHRDYPSFNFGRHIGTSLDGSGNIEFLDDKEVLNYLIKYQEELAFDGSNICDEAYVERIKKDAEDLFDNIELDGD